MARIDISNKTLDLPTLQAELQAAGFAPRGIGTYAHELITYGADGFLVHDWPPKAVAIVDAHVPPEPGPSDFDVLNEMLANIDTTGNTALEELLIVLQAQTEIIKTRIGG